MYAINNGINILRSSTKVFLLSTFHSTCCKMRKMWLLNHLLVWPVLTDVTSAWLKLTDVTSALLEITDVASAKAASVARSSAETCSSWLADEDFVFNSAAIKW